MESNVKGKLTDCHRWVLMVSVMIMAAIPNYDDHRRKTRLQDLTLINNWYKCITYITTNSIVATDATKFVENKMQQFNITHKQIEEDIIVSK